MNRISRYKIDVKNTESNNFRSSHLKKKISNHDFILWFADFHVPNRWSPFSMDALLYYAVLKKNKPF